MTLNVWIAVVSERPIWLLGAIELVGPSTRLRQAQLIHEFRTRTSEGSDDVARLCLVDAGWDMTVAVGRFLTGIPEGLPPQGGTALWSVGGAHAVV
eukprot:COSAG02_NODE_3174_length_7227_cov_30.253227_4_plen_96_part_00